MKKLCLLFSLSPIFLWGQVKIDFETVLSTRWEQSPAGRWGATSEGVLSDSYSLGHLFDNSESGRDAISYYFGEIDLEKPVSWKFLIHHNYNPSGSNNWAVYLLSNIGAQTMASGIGAEALILGVNQKETDDSLRLYYQDESSFYRLLNLGVNWEVDVEKSIYQFEIQKDSCNSFSFYGAKVNEDLNLLYQSEKNLKIPDNPEYFGLGFEYTSTKDRLLFFDDFEFNATSVIDSIAPKLKGCKYISHNEIEWVFSENVFPGDNFLLQIDGDIIPDSIHFLGNKVITMFSYSFQNDKEYHFEISGFQDKKQNAGSVSGELSFYYPEFKDLIFTEIMADPSPVVYLPESEYLEIYNRSGHEINLEKFKLRIGLKEFAIGYKSISNNSYLALVNESVSYSDSSLFYPLLTSSTALTNGGQEISLWSPDGSLIDAAEYSDSWYDDEMKSEGGWSLERTDMFNLCGRDELWTASKNKNGGTPGKENSWNLSITDNEKPFIASVEFIDSFSYKLHFNETIFFNPQQWDNIFSLYYSSLLQDELEILLSENSVSSLSFETGIFVEDCEGNSNESDSLIFSIPEKLEVLDVLITEVMFSALPGCAEFVEIYNYSDKVLNLNELIIDIYSEGELPSQGNFLSEKNFLFYPGSYILIVRDRSDLENCYEVNKQNIIELKDLKTLADNGGRVAVRNRSYTLIDEMEYSDDMHFDMLADRHGISLERVNISKKFGLNSTWHSASQTSGFSTPGYPNSQLLQKEETGNSFHIFSEIFTPNNDGVEDIAQMEYSMDSEGFVGSVMIFDPSGRVVRSLEMNVLLGASGNFYWDGEDDSGRLCSSGIYLVYFSCFHLSGKKEEFKETVVLLRGY